ncbi:hypothetical protein [uncultured Bacteroides sp.]|uniref:hypothetical protein n=1 Tax=uncultured Bacteroides sp. TaxID=162156 RepID=UPI0035A6CDC5
MRKLTVLFIMLLLGIHMMYAQQLNIKDTVTDKRLSEPIIGASVLYVQFDNHATGYRGLRTKTHTFVVHATNSVIDDTTLFDRTKDPYQMNNIAKQHPRLVQKFSKQLKDWLVQTDDPFANYLKP